MAGASTNSQGDSKEQKKPDVPEIKPEDLEKAKKLQAALGSIKESPDSETIAETLNDSIRTEGNLDAKELRQLKLQIEGALAKVDPTLSVPEHILTNDGIVQLAMNAGLLDATTYKSLILQSAQKKPGTTNTGSVESTGRSVDQLDEQYQSLKSQFLRARSPSERRAFSAQMRQVRTEIEYKLGFNYSLYRQQKKAERNRHREEVTEISYNQDGDKTVYNTETGSRVTFHSRSAPEPSVSDDDLRAAKRTIDRGPMGGARHQLPRDRIASDGRVNFFTEGDRKDVQDFLNARSARRLARLEQMESFAAQRADIMDVLTNPDRFEREFQKIKDAPINFSAPGMMERARKNNVVHFLLSKDHTMVHDVANEPPTRAEIEALRHDAIFRDSWNKVDRRSKNMMNFDQFITFRQTGWEDRDTEKFIPTMAKDGFVKEYAYIFHKKTHQELVIDPKGEIVAHRWQKPLQDGKIMIAETRFGRPKGAPLKVSRVDFQKTWKDGVPGKLALRDQDGKSLPEHFTIDLAKFPRDGRGMMIGDVAWIERDGNSAFKILFMKEGNYDLHALEATTKHRKHALVAVTKGPEKQQTA